MRSRITRCARDPECGVDSDKSKLLAQFFGFFVFAKMLKQSLAFCLKQKIPTAKSSRDLSVGVAGFEPATSWSQTRRDDRATLHPESGCKYKTIFYFHNAKRRFLNILCALRDANDFLDLGQYGHQLFKILDDKILLLDHVGPEWRIQNSLDLKRHF